MNIVISKSDLKLLCLEVFFILSFAYITYASNIYIVWGIITLIPILFFTKRNNIIPFLFTICFFFFVCLYYVLYGIEGGFRILKTYTICLTFIILSQSKQEAEKIQILLKPLHYFMTLSAWIVCIDFVLYWGGGHTIMNFTSSGLMPRPNGLMEDSNFYSYLMVCYIMYLKYTYGKSTKLFIISIFLSGSFSAIMILLLLLFFYKRTTINNLSQRMQKWKVWRILIIMSVLIIHLSYYMILEYKNQIIDYIEAVDMNPLLKVKAASMFHRFESQEIAIHEINKSGKYFFGGGPGITRTLNDRDMNLHNTYYQMYVEIGGIMLFIVAFFLFYYMLDIKNVSFLLLFGIMSLFGNMLEVFYAPVLSFIYFLYKLNGHVTSSKKFSDNFSYNMYE